MDKSPSAEASESGRIRTVKSRASSVHPDGIVGLHVQAAVARIVISGVFVAILFARPAGLLGVERR
jgi:hypothetical protein